MWKRKLSTKAQEYLSKQLFQVIEDNDIETVKAVIELGVDVNAKDKDGWTALMCACEKGQVKCAKLLLEHGVVVNAKEIDKYIKKWDCMYQELIEAYVNAQTNEKNKK